MLEYDWENSVGYWVCATSHALRKALSHELNDSPITLRQWEVLAWLSCNGCESQSQLAEVLGIEANTLGGVVTRMEEAGLVKRGTCPNDKRKNTIQPTEKAEQVWAEVSEIAHRVRAQATHGISDDELANYKKVCTQIHQNLSATPFFE